MWERKHISHVRCVWCYACTQSALDDCDGIYMETLDLYSCIYFLWSQQLYGCGGIFYLVHRADTNPLIFTALLQQIHLNPFSSKTLKGAIWRKSNVSHTLCRYTHRWKERLLMENMACNKKSSILIHLRCKIGGMGGWWGWTQFLDSGSCGQTVETPESIHGLRRWNPHQPLHLLNVSFPYCTCFSSHKRVPVRNLDQSASDWTKLSFLFKPFVST